MPSPSAGCQTCTSRRIKCDETKPICLRCIKSRRVCVEQSAAQQASFTIHLENRYASGKTKRPRGPRSSLSLLRPQCDLRSRALTYYLQNHVETLANVPNLSRSLSECVSAWKASGQTSSMVDLALYSTALAVFSRTQQHLPAAMEASSTYYRLLRVAQERIAEVEILQMDERNIDDCLLAVFLMCRFETVTHRSGYPNSSESFNSAFNWSHYDGAMAILKVWNDNLSFHTATAAMKQTRRGLIRTCLLRNLPVPDWMLNGHRFGEDGLELEYDRIFVRIVNLHYESTKLPKIGLQMAQELSREARELDNALQAWTTYVPRTCSWKRHVLKDPGPFPRKHYFSSIVYSYPRPGYASVWSQLFATSMLVNSIFLRFLERSRRNTLVDSTYEKQRLDCILQLKAMTNNLASSIPFCLKRFEVNKDSFKSPITLNTKEIKPTLANLAVWPLTIGSSIEGIDAEHQLWFRSELAFLGRVTGDGVLESAGTAHWAVSL